MKTPRLCLALALLAFSPFALAQAPVCDVTCAPDPGGSGYDTTVDAMTKVQNMRGTETVYAPETAGSELVWGPGGGVLTSGQSAASRLARSKVVAGSSSYSY